MREAAIAKEVAVCLGLYVDEAISLCLLAREEELENDEKERIAMMVHAHLERLAKDFELLRS